MSYDPIIDFLALLRRTSAGAELARAPTLDLVVTAFARAGLLRLHVGQTAPTSNQLSTAWLQPAQPSWTAEGVLRLWDAGTSQYVQATPALWARQASGSGFAYVGTQLIQWGSVLATTAYPDTLVTFPKPFSGVPRVQLTVNGANTVVAAGTTIVTRNGFNVAIAGALLQPTANVDWLATGPTE